MPKSAKRLLIGSMDAYGGKSVTALGMASQFRGCGVQFAYGKPLNIAENKQEVLEADREVAFVCESLNLDASQFFPTVLTLTPEAMHEWMTTAKPMQGRIKLLEAAATLQEVDVLLLEGPSTMSEGTLCGLSLLQQAEALEAHVLLVTRCHSSAAVDTLLCAKSILGDRLLGVVLNDIPESFTKTVQQTLVPFLEQQNILVFGQIPRHRLLRSISVRELKRQLNAELLCGGERLDLMVEQLKIGAMNVNSALRFFNKGSNMAVVTGGDRTDIQLAALESSTHCLILTGHFLPNSIVIQRAEDLEIPILSVDLDTLTTVEIVDRAFDQARLTESIKVDCIQHLFSEYADSQRLLKLLGLQPSLAL